MMCSTHVLNEYEALDDCGISAEVVSTCCDCALRSRCEASTTRSQYTRSASSISDFFSKRSRLPMSLCSKQCRKRTISAKRAMSACLSSRFGCLQMGDALQKRRSDKSIKCTISSSSSCTLAAEASSPACYTTLSMMSCRSELTLTEMRCRNGQSA